MGVSHVKTFPRWGYAFSIALLGLTILIGWLIGNLATPSGEAFDWSVAAVAATAFATMALAGGTFILASATLADAGASKAIADLTQQDMRLRDRPTIMVTHFYINDKQPICLFSFENVGMAPAAYITANVSGFDSSGDAVLTTGPISIGRVIRPGAALDIAVAFAVRGNIADWNMTELLTASLDRRGGVNHSLWRRKREGHTFFAASDFLKNWCPDESMLERLAGEPTSPVSVREPGGEWSQRGTDDGEEVGPGRSVGAVEDGP
jgi:hypothetical protein